MNAHTHVADIRNQTMPQNFFVKVVINGKLFLVDICSHITYHIVSHVHDEEQAQNVQFINIWAKLF